MNAHRCPLVLALLVVAAPAQTLLDAPQVVLSDPTGRIRAVADFDADGRPDLLVTTTPSSAFAIDGMHVRFATPAGDYVPGPPIARHGGNEGEAYVLAGDVTGDGAPDVITSVRGTGIDGFVTYPNAGNGTFATPVLTRTGPPAWFCRAVLDDWNGDGVRELVAVHLGIGTGTLQRWTWQNGTFVGSTPTATPSWIRQVAVGELTGDALPDVLCGDADFGFVYLAPTVPGGGFGAMTTIPVGTAVGGRSAACGDMDGDGDDDVVVAWRSAANTVLARITHDGAGGLTVGPATTFDVYPGGHWTGAPHLMDWDGDRDLDVGVCFEELHLLENAGGSLTAAGSMRVAPSPTLGVTQTGDDGVGAIDLDGDGHLDFVAGRAVLRGHGGFVDVFFDDLFGAVTRTIDWDDDGDLDVLQTDGKLRVNHGRNRFRTVDLLPDPPVGFHYAIVAACADFTGDGRSDLVVGWFRTRPMQFIFVEMRLLERRAAGDFVDRGAAAAPGERLNDGSSFVEHADLDGDGDVDLATEGGYWENSGNGTFPTFHSVWQGEPSRLADVDGDARIDVLVKETIGQTTRYALYHNLQSGFAPTGLATGPADQRSRAELVDLDGDRDLDFAVGLTAGPTIVLRENRSGAFSPPVVVPSRDHAFETIVVDDFDADGRPDLAAFPSVASGGEPPLGASALAWTRTGPGLTYAAPAAFVTSSPVTGSADLDGDGDVEAFGRDGVVPSGRITGAAAGSFQQYGDAEAGPSGVAPVLGVSGPIRASATLELRIRGGRGRSAGILVFGSRSAAVPVLPLGGLTLRVTPIVASLPLALQGPAGVAGAGTFDLPLVVPPALRGVRLFQQAFLIDGPGFAATQGLELQIGG